MKIEDVSRGRKLVGKEERGGYVGRCEGFGGSKNCSSCFVRGLELFWLVGSIVS